MLVGSKMAGEFAITWRIKVANLAVEVCDCLRGFRVLWTNCQRTFIRLPVPIPMGRIFRSVVACITMKGRSHFRLVTPGCVVLLSVGLVGQLVVTKVTHKYAIQCAVANNLVGYCITMIIPLRICHRVIVSRAVIAMGWRPPLDD